MSFVVYDTESTLLLRVGHNTPTSYKTQGAAKAALTRIIRERANAPLLTADQRNTIEASRSDFVIADEKTFYDTIEKKETRHGIVGSAGKEFVVGVNTSWTSGPWSETYWCS